VQNYRVVGSDTGIRTRVSAVRGHRPTTGNILK
jgi:hypothetical protein